MVAAVNRVFEHAGREYHLQAEDSGLEHRRFEVRVYQGGGVLWHKRVPYDDIVARNLPKTEFEETLHALMEKTLHTVEAAIAKGKLT